MANYKDVNARCPYYRGESAKRHKIFCEGLGDAEEMVWKYREADEGQRIRQLEIFCWGCYTKCEVHRMIEQEKYSE